MKCLSIRNLDTSNFYFILLSLVVICLPRYPPLPPPPLGTLAPVPPSVSVWVRVCRKKVVQI